ncbi:hypothetical protein [Janthinobacterium fluminis]|uniref:Lipoprotein n=1 Tax=Janthinobacterium fluminis TaxID=2987524 RepID=A0ABT5JWF5_9BURK|nr:hypothetical protein [Janthinobacterium fluminis]MDC8757067.1 hypothetical protein [Janthinobacterium fluminis]
MPVDPVRQYTRAWRGYPEVANALKFPDLQLTPSKMNLRCATLLAVAALCGCARPLPSPENTAAPDANAELIAQAQAARIEAASQRREEAAQMRGWQYSARTDEASRIESTFAQLLSTNQLDFLPPYDGGSRGDIVLRQRPGEELAVIFSISNGQIVCLPSCTIQVRFDDAAPVAFNGSVPSNRSITTLFLWPADTFLAKLRTARRMRVEIPYFRHGLQVSEFDVDGLAWEHAAVQAKKPDAIR